MCLCGWHPAASSVEDSGEVSTKTRFVADPEGGEPLDDDGPLWPPVPEGTVFVVEATRRDHPSTHPLGMSRSGVAD